MDEIKRSLRTRMREIAKYVRMLQFVEGAGGTVNLSARTGAPHAIDLTTIHVMKAGVFLHLYNLVESIVTTSLGHIVSEIVARAVAYQDLEDCWQRAWAATKFDTNLSADKRLIAALEMCRSVAANEVISIKPKFTTGTLDDVRIEEIAKRFGIPLRIAPSVRTEVKRHVFNNLGCLGLVRKQRNDLAHGTESFADIGKNYSASDLAQWSAITYRYLRALLSNFEAYATAQQYRRSAATAVTQAGGGS